MSPPEGITLSDCSRVDRPCLTVVIDTEEEFDWGAPLSRRNTEVESLRSLHKGQRVFSAYGIRPAYLVDYPVAISEIARRVFGEWLASGSCLLGAQLHPWVTPPKEEPVCPENSFACNLPPLLERRKLETLTAAIRDSLGVQPRIYKAGRYGLDVRRERALVELGYLADTSVVPHASFSGKGGGPDFFGFPSQPFWGREGLFYLPLSQFLTGAMRRIVPPRLQRAIYSGQSERLHIPGLLARTRLLERIRLSPEGATLPELCRLLDQMLEDGQRVFSLSLHSPSLFIGATPYVRTEADLAEFLSRIDGFLRYFFTKAGGVATDPLALRELLAAQPR